jgi:hypothetical protein
MTKITADHLGRGAFVYIRQSTADQLLHNLESLYERRGLVRIIGLSPQSAAASARPGGRPPRGGSRDRAPSADEQHHRRGDW